MKRIYSVQISVCTSYSRARLVMTAKAGRAVRHVPTRGTQSQSAGGAGGGIQSKFIISFRYQVPSRQLFMLPGIEVIDVHVAIQGVEGPVIVDVMGQVHLTGLRGPELGVDVVYHVIDV